MSSDPTPCLYGTHAKGFGLQHCNSWNCPRCHRGQRSLYCNVLLTDFRSRPREWFQELHFVVLRPCRRVQEIPFADGLRLTTAILKQFHRLLREQVTYSHFSFTEDTAWHPEKWEFVPSLHTHAFFHGMLTKSVVRACYLQAHRDVLGPDALDPAESKTVTVYFHPCARPFRAGMYLMKHGQQYKSQGRACRSLDLKVHKSNPPRVDYTRQGKGPAPFFSRPMSDLKKQVRVGWREWRQEQIRNRPKWSPSEPEPADHASEVSHDHANLTGTLDAPVAGQRDERVAAKSGGRPYRTFWTRTARSYSWVATEGRAGVYPPAKVIRQPAVKRPTGVLLASRKARAPPDTMRCVTSTRPSRGPRYDPGRSPSRDGAGTQPTGGRDVASRTAGTHHQPDRGQPAGRVPAVAEALVGGRGRWSPG